MILAAAGLSVAARISQQENLTIKLVDALIIALMAIRKQSG
jgi:hypothetical protein